MVRPNPKLERKSKKRKVIRDDFDSSMLEISGTSFSPMANSTMIEEVSNGTLSNIVSGPDAEVFPTRESDSCSRNADIDELDSWPYFPDSTIEHQQDGEKISNEFRRH
jgi:hypothetical protein